jgi:hypothetical protein
MVDVYVSVPPLRYRAALAEGMKRGLIPAADEVYAMNEDEARRAASIVVLAVLAPEIEWLEDRGIDCVITATTDDTVFILGFESAAEAALFRTAWSGEVTGERAAAMLLQ